LLVAEIATGNYSYALAMVALGIARLMGRTAALLPLRDLLTSAAAAIATIEPPLSERRSLSAMCRWLFSLSVT